jgi:hypothetical protein
MRFKYLILALFPLILINCKLLQRELSVSVPDTIIEENTIITEAGIITIEQATDELLIVDLEMSSNGRGHLSMPGYVEIQAGDLYAKFDIEVVDMDVDEYNSGGDEITITASTSGYESGSDTTILVYQDNDY